MNPTDTLATGSAAAVAQHLPVVLRGQSAAAMRQLREIRDAEADGAAVLITAEAGLDVLEVAHRLHGNGPGAFVRVACDEASPARAESVLFGVADTRLDHVLGLERVRQSAALASARTIVVCELSELAAGLQRRLARVLRDGEVYVQELRRAVPLPARIVATAGPHVEEDVQAGRVRPDLYRRLNARRIALAPLRERPDDIPELVAALAKDIAQAHHSAPRTYAPAALTALASLPWPRNLDELRELLTRLHGIAPGAPARQEDVLHAVAFGNSPSRVARFDRLRDARKRFEREYIAAVLEQHGWRMTQAAATLGIERANLYRKIRQLGLRRPGGGRP